MKNDSTAYAQPLEITPNQGWEIDFWEALLPAKDRVSQHPFFIEFAAGSLDLACVRHALKNFYPLVARFPSYMALNLAKATEFQLPGVTEARNWLIQNIKIEERHLFWYRDWAAGFGLSSELLDNNLPPAAMNAVNHFLWSVNKRLSLAEGLAATNLAIEWATGEWTEQVYHGMKHYRRYPEVDISRRSLAWLKAHAIYDDVHPYEVMELIKRLCAHDEQAQQRTLNAAKEGLAYYELALDHCMQASHWG